MEFFVIDTNVAIVANNKAPQAGPDCVLRCIDILEKIIRTEGVTLDDLMLILREYMYASPESERSAWTRRCIPEMDLAKSG